VSARIEPAPAARPASGLGGLAEPFLRNRVLGVAAFLGLLVLFFSVVAQNFVAVANANTIALNASILVVVACAEAVVVLTRNYDLSVGSMVALVAYVGLDLVRLLPDLGPVLVLVPVLLGATCGLVNGLLVAYGGIPSVIATLGTMSMYRGLAFLYAGGGQLNAADLPPWVQATASSHVLGVSTLVLVAVLVVAATAAMLRHTRFGRQVYAVGSNPQAAVFYGLDRRRVVLGAYVVTGLLTGLAAYLFGARATYVVPYLAQGLEFTALAAVVVGGVSVLGGSGSVAGAALGAVALATIDNGLVLTGASEFTRQLIQGLAIVVAVVVDAVLQRRIAELLRTRRRRRTRA
jgi:rhamnose transport system permease protein